MAAQATNRTERAVKGTLVSFLQYGTQMLLQALLAPIVLRLAGQETLGAYALLMQIMGYLAMLDLGFSVTLNRYLANAKGYEDGGSRFRDVLSTARTFLLGSNIIIAVLTLLVGLKADAIFSLSQSAATQARLGLAFLALWGVLRTPWIVYGIGLNATQNLAAANFIGIIGNTTRLLLSLGLLAAGTGLVGLMLGNVLAEILSTALSAWRFRRLYPLHSPVWGIPDSKLFREMMAFSVQALLINIAWRLVYYTDNIIVGYLYGAAAVSIYYTTQMPATVGFNIVNRVSDNASPAVSELFARGEENKLREVFLRLHRYNYLLALPLVAGLLLFNKQLVTLWVGPGQYAGDLMTVALAVFALLITVSHVNVTFVFASGNIRRFSLVAILEGIANLGLSLWLGRLIGPPGVMVATVIANIPSTTYLLVLSMRLLKVGVLEYLLECILPTMLPIAIGIVATILAGRLITGSGWLSFITQGAVLMIVYCVIVYRLNLNRKEREWFGTLLIRD
jgi:O-antigen/teichoic acid export membrane protein